MSKKHDFYSLTRFCHSLDGNILFVGHEAQHREDGKTCYKAGATVQTTQHEAVPEEQDRQKEKRSRLLEEVCVMNVNLYHMCQPSILINHLLPVGLCLYSYIHIYTYTSIHILVLPVAVIVVGIVTSQSSKTTQADSIREEDLGSSVHPHLRKINIQYIR